MNTGPEPNFVTIASNAAKLNMFASGNDSKSSVQGLLLYHFTVLELFPFSWLL